MEASTTQQLVLGHQRVPFECQPAWFRMELGVEFGALDGWRPWHVSTKAQIASMRQTLHAASLFNTSR